MRVRIIYVCVFVIVIGLMGDRLIRPMSQCRMEYAGGLTIIGWPEGYWGARYQRIHFWREVNASTPYPDLSIALGEKRVRLADFTPEGLAAMGGSVPEGAFYDRTGALLQYRFDGERLVWFALEAGEEGRPVNETGQAAFDVRLGDIGLHFPASGRDVEKAWGRPLHRYRSFWQ